MLGTLRKGATGFLSKLLLLLLIASFAVWGIGDIFRGTGNENVVATIDDESISLNMLESMIGRIQSQFGDVQNDIFRDVGFRTEILNKLINDELVEREAEELGLRASQDSLIGMIARNPSFQKEDGSFDRARFVATLRQNGLSEKAYLGQLSDQVASNFLVNTISTGMPVSEAMVKKLFTIREETREAELMLISDKHTPKIDAPTDEQLRDYYDANTHQYMQPEYRSLSYVIMSAETLFASLNLDPSDDEIAGLYEERKEAYRVPETRNADQLLFSTQATANAVYEQLVAGTSYDDAAKNDSVLNADNISLGDITQADVPQDIAPAIFALQAETYSQPVQSSFGWHIFRVNNIAESHIPPLDELKDRLLENYRAEVAGEEMNRLSGEIEDALAAGESIETALTQSGLSDMKLETLEHIDMNGERADGNKTDITPVMRQVLDTGFSLDNGETSTLSLTTENDYYLVHVDDVIESQAKAFDDVKSLVQTAWNNQENARALKAFATALADGIASGEDFSATAKQHAIPVEKSGTLKRYHDTVSNNSALKDKILTEGFVTSIFGLKQGDATGAYPLPSGEYAIAKITNISPAPEFIAATQTHAEEIDAIRKELKNALPNELMDEYINALKQTHDVSINYDMLMGAPE